MGLLSRYLDKENRVQGEVSIGDISLGITSKTHRKKSGKNVSIVKGFNQNW